MKIVNKETKEIFDFENKRFSGNENTKCPKCKDSRKKGNANKTPFTWNHDKQVGNCHNCGAVFYSISALSRNNKQYERPVWVNNTELSDKAVKFFESRGISQFTLRRANVTSQTKWMPKSNAITDVICFNYFDGEELINVMYRGPQKDIQFFKDGEMIIYNLNAVKGKKEFVIVEGQPDCLAYMESGIENVCSVPNGAANFDFLDKHFDLFDACETLYVAVDDDVAGIALRNEIIRRVGIEKCRIVDFEGEKDANDYLMSRGKEALNNTIKNAKEIPIEGITTVDDVWDDMIYSFRNGKVHGTTTYMRRLDSHWTWRSREVTLWTGYMNEGKTCFFTDLAVKKAANEGIKFGIFTPENYPVGEYYDELIHAYVGKSTDKRYNNCMTEEEYFIAKDFIHNHFFIVDPKDEDYTPDNVLKLMRVLIKKYGINHCLFDPYNQFDHVMPNGQREDLYIAKFMSKLKRFSINNDVGVHLIAHQVTPEFRGGDDYPQPDPYKIKGGGTFTDKADNTNIVWRPFKKSDYQDTTVRIIVSKVKKQKLVGVPGQIDIKYDVLRNQFYDECDGVTDLFRDYSEPLKNQNDADVNIESFRFSDTEPRLDMLDEVDMPF